MNYEIKKKLNAVLNLSASVIPSIWFLVVISMISSAIITIFYHGGANWLHQPSLVSLIPSVVLGLLLVFRTNASYDRFWEGRKIIGQLINDSRSLAILLLVNIPEKNREDTVEKMAKVRLIAVFFIALKLHLRKESVDEKIKSLVTEEEYLELKNVNSMPLKIMTWMAEYTKKMYDRDYIDSIQLTEYNQLIERLVGYLGACERILNTPIPLAYSIHLKHLLFIYCGVLPFYLLEDLSWLTIPAVGIITFALLGIEAIGTEIENPFGYDPNDLPLDHLNNVLHSNLEELMMSNHRK